MADDETAAAPEAVQVFKTRPSSSHRPPTQPHRRSKSAMVSLLSTTSSTASRSHSRSSSLAHSPVAGPPARSYRDTMPASSSSSIPTPANDKGGVSGSSSLTGSGVLVGGARSVEETVRTFRLYEALRNGDTAAISRAIRDSTDDGGRRGSMVSVATTTTIDLNKHNILQLAVQCAELPVIEYILSTTTSSPTGPPGFAYLDINNRDSSTGNTPLHVAAQMGRPEVVGLLLKQPTINDSVHNYSNRTPLDVARTPQIFQMLQMARSLYLEEQINRIHQLIEQQSYGELEELLETPRVKGLLDLNALEPPNQPGSTLLHDAARRKDTKLIQLLLMHGADPFRRDRRGKLPQDVTKDEKVRGVLKKSPAAVAAARSIEERAVLGSAAEAGVPGIQIDGGSSGLLGGKESRETKGYLKKWTNYTSGWKLRWFVLEDGVLSYYKNQEDTGSACRGAINMRIAKLHMAPDDKQRFEIQGKGSVKYHLKANHIIEAKKWYWTLNNAIQCAKDEAREDDKRKAGEAEKIERLKEYQKNEEKDSHVTLELSRADSIRSTSLGRSDSVAGEGSRESVRAGKRVSLRPQSSIVSEDNYPSDSGITTHGVSSINTEATLYESGEGEEEEIDDDSSSHNHEEPPSIDQLALVANSARLQMDLLSQVVLALQFENANNPDLKLNDPTVAEAMASYEAAVLSLKQLVGDVLVMGKQRDAYWRNRLEKEMALRKLWEESMTMLAEEQEHLEGKVVGERERRKKTKRVLKRILQKEGSEPVDHAHEIDEEGVEQLDKKLKNIAEAEGRGLTIVETLEEMELSETESESGDEFFDAIDSGEVEVVTEMPISLKSPPLSAKEEVDETQQLGEGLREKKLVAIKSAFRGYEEPPRTRLAMDDDNRPKISLWGILKSMIGKDMTKMTLPVSFNEPTSLLQRVAEDMEYTDLLDFAADRTDSSERMVYVAAFAASEYSSTTGRVAKPFNPLLGETYEYARPDKGYRFFVEQVSHHPVIGAAWAESAKWDYWGESAVKSKFLGKSFDINPLGTWFLRLRPASGGEELYTWKKVTSSVVGIITGSPTVDNYGLMEIRNWTTGDVCHLDFKARGWRGANAYEVKGRICDVNEQQHWSIGGRWNDKLYARLSPGFDANISPPPTVVSSTTRSSGFGSSAAFKIWENHERPPAPFSLTPFAITLNALSDSLRPVLCPTDTRLRPDQRAMEDGEYDFAATEKNRLEEKQRAKRRQREESGEEYAPRWFRKSKEPITGEDYWEFLGEYWTCREKVSSGQASWADMSVEDIF